MLIDDHEANQGKRIHNSIKDNLPSIVRPFFWKKKEKELEANSILKQVTHKIHPSIMAQSLIGKEKS